MVRQSDPTYGQGNTDLHLESFWFATDGTNNPSEHSANIKSVTRFTSDGTVPLYRIRLREAYPFVQNFTTGEAWSVTQDEADDLAASRVLNALNATIAAEEALEIDIKVSVRNTGVATNSTAAGAIVSGIVFFDASAQ